MLFQSTEKIGCGELHFKRLSLNIICLRPIKSIWYSSTREFMHEKKPGCKKYVLAMAKEDRCISSRNRRENGLMAKRPKDLNDDWCEVKLPRLGTLSIKSIFLHSALVCSRELRIN